MNLNTRLKIESQIRERRRLDNERRADLISKALEQGGPLAARILELLEIARGRRDNAT